MKKIYSVKLNGNEVFMVREENNTIGMMFQGVADAIDFMDGKDKVPFGVAVNNEVLTMGTSVGWLKDIKEQ